MQQQDFIRLASFWSHYGRLRQLLLISCLAHVKQFTITPYLTNKDFQLRSMLYNHDSRADND